MADADKAPEPFNFAGGARLDSEYHSATQTVVPVPVSEIKDASASATEEIVQFAVGGFMFSGAFWLGLERLFTEGIKDPLLAVCVLSCVFGAVLGFAGFRQAQRRVKRLERYCPKDDQPPQGP